MKRMIFDSSGKITSIDGKDIEKIEEMNSNLARFEKTHLKTSDSLSFLKDEKLSGFYDSRFWSLYSDGKKLEPLKFSNGKSQEDIVREVVELITKGTKVIFIHGVCGTGKSAIALNIARVLGRASIVVPGKSLQKQYEEDYMVDKYVLKHNGDKMKIAIITGRENHDSIIEPGVSCADPFLPDTINITEKNFGRIKEYYDENSFINSREMPELKEIKRISIAPANPHWSPIIPADFELYQLRDAKKIRYKGMEGRDFIFYHRKPGCSYYDQYLAYILADTIIFNSAKYKLECEMGRKPYTDVEIIDEADDFLDSLSNQSDINLMRLSSSLKLIKSESKKTENTIMEILNLIDLEEKNKKALGVDKDKIFRIEETKISEILDAISKNSELESEILLDETNYANRIIEAAKIFKNNEEVYVTFRKKDDALHATLITTNLAKKVEDIVLRNKAIVFMSGTLHSEDVLKNIFGISDFKIVEAETINQGSVEIQKTGKEFDCKYSNFSSKIFSRREYFNALSLCLEKAKKPVLIHVNAFEDLPNKIEIEEYNITNIISSDKLKEIQNEDKIGKRVQMFKEGKIEFLFTTKCNRGIDFPGETCNSVIFTKYPNPNVNNVFWKILKKTHPSHYWSFYKDRSKREFLQRIYRAVRTPDDHVYILSPDSRVLDSVREFQINGKIK